MAKKQNIFGDAIGPFGFPMPSAVAARIDGLLKTLPAEIRKLGHCTIGGQAIEGLGRMRVTPKSFEAIEPERADVSFVTTDALDRQTEVILPEGADWGDWQKSGSPVTFDHDYSGLPVGRGLWVKGHKAVNDDLSETNGWLAKTGYVAKPADWAGDWFPDAVWFYVANGWMPSKSIGFIATAASPPTKAEINARPALAECSMVIRGWKTIEYAVAPIPVNVECTQLAMAKALKIGLQLPDAFYSLGLAVKAAGGAGKDSPAPPPAVKLTDTSGAARYRAAQKAAVAALGRIDVRKVVQDSLDTLRGKV